MNHKDFYHACCSMPDNVFDVVREVAHDRCGYTKHPFYDIPHKEPEDPHSAQIISRIRSPIELARFVEADHHHEQAYKHKKGSGFQGVPFRHRFLDMLRSIFDDASAVFSGFRQGIDKGDVVKQISAGGNLKTTKEMYHHVLGLPRGHFKLVKEMASQVSVPEHTPNTWICGVDMNEAKDLIKHRKHLQRISSFQTPYEAAKALELEYYANGKKEGGGLFSAFRGLFGKAAKLLKNGVVKAFRKISGRAAAAALASEKNMAEGAWEFVQLHTNLSSNIPLP